MSGKLNQKDVAALVRAAKVCLGQGVSGMEVAVQLLGLAADTADDIKVGSVGAEKLLHLADSAVRRINREEVSKKGAPPYDAECLEALAELIEGDAARKAA